jgi:hypothetical protein
MAIARRLVIVAVMALLLTIGLSGASAVAQAAPSPCPRVQFLGLHGLNEGTAGGNPDAAHWGSTVDDLWKKFRGEFPQSDSIGAQAVRYPMTYVPEQFPWNIGLVEGPTNHAADVLQAELLDLHLFCSNTLVVIAGYSQGAWAVDKATRNMSTSADPLTKSSLDSVVGVFLMGDPAWPIQGDSAGLATRFGRGYSTEGEYKDNGISESRFLSQCMRYSDGQSDPVCLGPLHPDHERSDWIRDLPVHRQYEEGGITQTGATFLAPLARESGGVG